MAECESLVLYVMFKLRRYWNVKPKYVLFFFQIVAKVIRANSGIDYKIFASFFFSPGYKLGLLNFYFSIKHVLTGIHGDMRRLI